MYRLVSSSSKRPTCDDMNIESAEVTTIRMISASATPTILRRIDWLNRENDFTTPRMDCGEAGESEPSCFKCEPCATDRNVRLTPGGDPDQRAEEEMPRIVATR